MNLFISHSSRPFEFMNMVGSSVVVVVLANYPFQARELA